MRSRVSRTACAPPARGVSRTWCMESETVSAYAYRLVCLTRYAVPGGGAVLIGLSGSAP